jgi:hypothetical protein
MIEFESLKDLHLLLNVKNNPRKHWADSCGWEMAECMHKFVLQNTKTIVWDFAFFALSAYEVTTINNKQWISVHAYVMQNHIHIPILLTLEWVEVGVIVKNITSTILQSIVKFRGLVEEQLASCWVCFGCDKDYVFQGHHIGVTT